MKCSIIKDLLPSYVDSLTSEESNIEIEGHLKECADCNQTYRQMRSDIEDSPVVQGIEEIKPLKKLNKKFRGSIIFSIVLTTIVCIITISGYNFLFNNGWQASSENVVIDYSYSEGEIVFYISLTHDRRLDVRGNFERNSGAELIISEKLYTPFSERFSEHSPVNEGKYSQMILGMPYIDENGNLIKFTDDNKMIFKCSDKEIVYSLKELVDALEDLNQ